MKTVRALVAGLVLMVALVAPSSASAATWSLFIIDSGGFVGIEGTYQSEAACEERANFLQAFGGALVTVCFVPQ